MSRPNCPFCNAGPKGDWAESETPWFKCGTMIHRDRTSRADQTNQCVEDEVGRIQDRVAAIEAFTARLEEAGNRMADVLTWSSGVAYRKSPTASAWAQAKATKPSLHPDFRAGEMVTAPPVAGERHPRPVKVGDDVNSQGHPAEAVSYRFRTFQELMDRVPTSRMDDCFHEMGVWFRLAKSGIEAVVAEHKQKNPEFIIPDSLLEVPKELEWIDDGKGQIQATLLHQDGAVRLVAKSGPKNTQP